MQTIFKALRLQRLQFAGFCKSTDGPQYPAGRKDWGPIQAQQSEALRDWMYGLDSMIFSNEMVLSQIQNSKAEIFSKINAKSHTRSIALDKLLVKAIFEAYIPKEIAQEYINDVKNRFITGFINENAFTIMQYILREKLLDGFQDFKFRQYLMASKEFKVSIEKILQKPKSITTFATILKLLETLDYHDPQLIEFIQEQIHRNKQTFCLLESDNRQMAAKQVMRTVISLKTIARFFFDKGATGRFKKLHPLINSTIYECCTETVENCIKYSDEIKPEAIETLAALFFHSNLCSPDSKLFARFTILVEKMVGVFGSNRAILLLNYFTKSGCDRNLPLASMLEANLIEQYSTYQDDYDTLSLVSALRSSIYFNLKNYIEFLLSQNEIKYKLQEFAKRPYWVSEVSNQFYQTLFKLQLLKYTDMKIDYQYCSQVMFAQAQQNTPSIEVQDICEYLKIMGIPYTKEVIIGGYWVDAYIPNLPKTFTQINHHDSEVLFSNFIESDEFVTKTINDDSIFLEFDGKNHFYDKQQTLYTGACIMKRDFMKKHMKLQVSVLKNKAIQEWNNQADQNEKCKSLLKLIQQSIHI